MPFVKSVNFLPLGVKNKANSVNFFNFWAKNYENFVNFLRIFGAKNFIDKNCVNFLAKQPQNP